MGVNNTHSSRSLPIAVAILALLYNLVFVTVCAYLPKDPLYLGQSISFYAWAGAALSVIGIVGIAKRNSTLVISFAHYLLLDTFVSTCCRLFILQIFSDEFSDQDICSGAYTYPWRPDTLRNEVVKSTQWHPQQQKPQSHIRRCQVAMDAAQIILVGFLLASTAAQCMLAIGMRRFGKELERATALSSNESQKGSSEKALFIEKV
ncbi:hypothetical protein KC319_g12625 [Hortaea werneckii]|nr:hypothetical protein KC323_g2757 [Hortaea werneckii]KAI6873353.1 hypothetical protein KC338_g1672 [Hortaea werneckii]KAI7356983.1 hypothetical protein KC320_g1987 [Hortaea werneckii]KAI7555199.1 hypothetical protein KC317_g13085 [Hortaea werneckii]KAI7643493.1 hypothetical protein KC319_g12625 [Hortaea werneckii]